MSATESTPAPNPSSDAPVPAQETSAVPVASDSESPVRPVTDTGSSAPTPRSLPAVLDDPAIETPASGGAMVTTRPRHPMPMHFPEVHLPEVSRPAPPTPMPIVPAVPPPDPHSVHDGTGYVAERLACIRCGSTNLARGQVVDHGDKFRDLRFAPKRVTLRRLNSLLSLRPFRSLVKMNALACRDCGLIQMIVDPSDLRRAERHRE
ncbi:MAG: hypothetical protein ACYDBJ_02365 [Aggregatilineales bacterium]